MAQIGEDKEGSAPFLDGNKEIALFRSMKVVLPLFIAAISFAVSAQIPKNGTYTYAIAFAEWDGKSNGATCTVVIKGDSIKVIHNGLGNLTGKKGEILDAGIIMKHKKTGKYIIAHNAADADASQANGCEGPSVIDFDKKKFWLC
ncbi:MAG TPA: hypothetical protein VIU12_11210 [Chryseolinea sp.]